MFQPNHNHQKSYTHKLLWTLSLLYDSVGRGRRKLYHQHKHVIKKLPVPVLSIGNLAVGGTGKTPMTIYLAQRLLKENFRPAIISRGYGGDAEKKGVIVSNATTVLANALQAGDEPVMMAQRLAGVPVIVGKNRFESGRVAVDKYGCNLILLDDGFQHLGLYRDLNILLLDAKRPLGNGHLIPRGILRESISAISDAHAVVFTRDCGRRSSDSVAVVSKLNSTPHFWASQTASAHEIDPQTFKRDDRTTADLRGKAAYLFSAIARNDDFFHTVKSLGAKVKGHAAFSDHHRYSHQQLSEIVAKATAARAEVLVTTEKDLARLGTFNPGPLQMIVIGVKIAFPNDRFDRYVLQSLKFQLK